MTWVSVYFVSIIYIFHSLLFVRKVLAERLALRIVDGNVIEVLHLGIHWFIIVTWVRILLALNGTANNITCSLANSISMTALATSVLLNVIVAPMMMILVLQHWGSCIVSVLEVSILEHLWREVRWVSCLHNVLANSLLS